MSHETELQAEVEGLQPGLADLRSDFSTLQKDYSTSETQVVHLRGRVLGLLDQVQRIKDADQFPGIDKNAELETLFGMIRDINA